MKPINTIITVLLCLCASLCFAEDKASLIYTEISPSENDKQRLIFEDESYRMIAVGYGTELNPS